jgi:hypothetical protein
MHYRYEEFSQCFPLLCEEDPQNAAAVFDDIRRYMVQMMEVHMTGPFLARPLIRLQFFSKSAKPSSVNTRQT